MNPGAFIPLKESHYKEGQRPEEIKKKISLPDGRNI